MVDSAQIQWIEDSSARVRYVSKRRRFSKSASDQTVTGADDTITLPVARQNSIRTEVGESHALVTAISNNNVDKVIQILSLSQKLLN